MELFETGSHYIVKADQERALCCSRETGFMEARNVQDLDFTADALCLGLCHSVIGRVQIGNDPDGNWLLLVSKQTEVGLLPGGDKIFRIDSVVFLPLTNSGSTGTSVTSNPDNNSLSVIDPQQQQSQPAEIESVRDLMANNLMRCPVHSRYTRQSSFNPDSAIAESARNSLSATTSAAGGVFKRTLGNLLNTATATIDTSTRYRKPESRIARRIIESLDKLFNDSPSFYYSPNADITTSTLRKTNDASKKSSSLVGDDRFFFNKALMSDLLNSQNHLSSQWIVPIIQGYVQFERVVVSIPSTLDSPTLTPEAKHFQNEPSNLSPTSGYYGNAIDLRIGVISRRSRHRAGTRYKKRGADELGHCANYVETEQILYWAPHWCSYVIVRGSVPLYWSQSGIQYRPPPKLEKTLGENAEAFALHFERELAYYKSISVVNLLHQSSKEEALCKAYLEHMLLYNSPLLTYISFDFNEHCRGMRFENVLILTQNIEEVIRDSSFTWTDSNGRICEQASVFRVNCLDCLDRTNIVEAAICRIMLELQCGKMGILPPDTALPAELLKVFKNLWANNGDAISRQYAGTNALKGDYTRTGEHGVTAALKDGFNSANRYYLNQFQDAARQVAIDVCLGIQPTFTERPSFGGSNSSQNLAQVFANEDATASASSGESLEAKCENLLAVMDDVRKMLLTEEDLCLGSWLLFDSSDPGVTNDVDFDVIMVLSMNSVFIVRLDLDGDPIFYYDIPLSSVEKVECGQLLLSGGGIIPFKKSRKVGGVKITYRKMLPLEESQSFDMSRALSSDTYCFVLRPANFRLFSGILIPVENGSDSQEVLTMISECFRNVTRISNLTFPVEDVGDAPLKFDKKRAARIDSHPNKIMWADSKQTLQALTIQSPPQIDSRRNSVMVPETDLASFGDPVISTVVNAPKKIFSTFKQFSNLLKPTQPVFVSGQPAAVVANKGNGTPPSLPTAFHVPGTRLPAAPLQESPEPLPQRPSTNRPNLGDEWKREIIKQMPICRTRIIQL